MLHFCYYYRYLPVINYLAIKLLRYLQFQHLQNITLLKTTCHFLLLLVGFDTLTYRKELQLIPYTCVSSAGRCARERLLVVAGNGDDALGTQHLHLEVGIVRYRHELGQCRPA